MFIIGKYRIYLLKKGMFGKGFVSHSKKIIGSSSLHKQIKLIDNIYITNSLTILLYDRLLTPKFQL